MEKNMKQKNPNEINFGVGFITGRENVCNIINSYYKHLVEQVKDLSKKVNFTFFILYDLDFLNSSEEDFYKIDPEVHNHINIKHMGPDYVENLKHEISKKYDMSEEEVNLIVGKGYAKARNSILYEAISEKVDYLLFWDDDEYPLAALENGDNIKWVMQDNVLQHIKNIENADITYGYRCGLINPVPTIEYNNQLTEDIYHKFIDAMENEVISWEVAKEVQKEVLGIGYAEKEIAEYKADNIVLDDIGRTQFVLGSGICLNLTHLDKMPAFYTAPEARGEDTFFSCSLREMNAKVVRIPVYHFHDAFLKFKFLTENKFPSKLNKIKSHGDGISLRFQRTSIGWAKYKPLLCYITDREHYKETMIKVKKNLKESVYEMSTAFQNCDLTGLEAVIESYDNDVEKHYAEYLKTNEVWNKLKFKIRKGTIIYENN